MSFLRHLGPVAAGAVLGAVESTVDDQGWHSERAIGDSWDVTPREEAAIRRIRALSHLLDEAVRVPGTNYRVRLDPILRIVPVGGDAVAAGLSLHPVLEAGRFEASRLRTARMLLYVGVDAAVESIPVLGTLLDASCRDQRPERPDGQALYPGVPTVAAASVSSVRPGFPPRSSPRSSGPSR